MWSWRLEDLKTGLGTMVSSIESAIQFVENECDLPLLIFDQYLSIERRMIITKFQVTFHLWSNYKTIFQKPKKRNTWRKCWKFKLILEIRSKSTFKFSYNLSWRDCTRTGYSRSACHSSMDRKIQRLVEMRVLRPKLLSASHTTLWTQLIPYGLRCRRGRLGGDKRMKWCVNNLFIFVYWRCFGWSFEICPFLDFKILRRCYWFWSMLMALMIFRMT